MTDPTRDDRDLAAEIVAGLERQRRRYNELIANAVVIAVLLLTLAVVMQLGAEWWVAARSPKGATR